MTNSYPTRRSAELRASASRFMLSCATCSQRKFPSMIGSMVRSSLTLIGSPALAAAGAARPSEAVVMASTTSVSVLVMCVALRRAPITGNPFQIGTKADAIARRRSEEHTSELQSLMRISYAVFCLKKKKHKKTKAEHTTRSHRDEQRQNKHTKKQTKQG